MSHLLKSTIALSSTLLLTSAALAESATFMFLDQASEANDMTPDGRIVVGTLMSGGGYYWTEEDGYTPIGGWSATAVSDDGLVIFGNMDNGAGQQVAGVWTEATGWQAIGGIPGDDGCGSISSAYELSADGSVGVGLAWLECSGSAFRWTPNGGVTGMEMLMNGNNRASVVSADGQVAGGFAQGSFSRTPAIWHADGTGQLLDPAGDALGEVHGISDDGTILLGEWNGDAFYMTDAEGIVTFETIFASWTGAPFDIADDGTIVGFDYYMTARIAWIRPAGENTSQLAQYLIARGAEGVPSQLKVAQAISTDGRMIIGHGWPDNAWIARLLPDADINGDGTVDVLDLLELLAAWGECTGDCPADLTGDGVVDVLDLLDLLAAWS